MGSLGLTMLVLAVGPALPPIDVPPVQLPPVKIPNVQLPPVQLPPMHLPKVEPPPVAKPPVATPTPPVATPAPKAPVAETGSAAPETAAAAPETTSARRAEPRRTATTRRDRGARPRAGVAQERGTTRPVVATATPAPTATPTMRRDAAREAAPPGIAGPVIDLVEALPAAILWSILGIAAVALGLAARAFRLSRQRGELLDDIGLLSRALLPPVPELEGLAVSAAYRPADGPAAGGDFYDVFTLDEDRVGVLLGDVSGHGRDTVTLAALARYTLRTLLAAGHGPGAALAEADRLLERDLRPRFATVIAAVYDRRSTRLTYAKAGHAPPIVVGTAHDTDSETPACPIGIGLGTAWPEYHVDLADGVSVCLVTDGFEEARRDGVPLGRAQVERLVAAQERPDATCLLNDLGALADQVCDDTAAVVVARA